MKTNHLKFDGHGNPAIEVDIEITVTPKYAMPSTEKERLRKRAYREKKRRAAIEKDFLPVSEYSEINAFKAETFGGGAYDYAQRSWAAFNEHVFFEGSLREEFICAAVAYQRISAAYYAASLKHRLAILEGKSPPSRED